MKTLSTGFYSIEELQAAFDENVRDGYMEQVQPGLYRLTPKGEQWVKDNLLECSNPECPIHNEVQVMPTQPERYLH